MVECREKNRIALIFFGVRIDIGSIVRVFIIVGFRDAFKEWILNNLRLGQTRKLKFRLRVRSWGKRNR